MVSMLLLLQRACCTPARAHLWWHADVLDGVAPDVGLGHPPEAVALLCATVATLRVPRREQHPCASMF